LILILLALFIFPLYFLIITSLKTMRESNITPPTLFPRELRPENYLLAWERMNFLHYLVNSALTTLFTIAGQLVVCVPCAYVFAKKQFKFKKLLFGIIVFDLLVPAQVTFLSIYLIESRLGWINTIQGLTLPFVYSAFTIFFLTQYFRTVPDEILDAAKMDRSSELQIMCQILVPVAKPAVIATMIFVFVYKWNDYFWTSILTTNETARTLTLALQNLLPVDHTAREWNIIMAGNMMLFLPMFGVYLVASKLIKQGFMYRGIK
jgi:sn-glycerol 3-phosphate transport system permease protein